MTASASASASAARPLARDPRPLAPAARLERYATALAGLEPPFAFVDLDAMWWNAEEMLVRAAPKPIRIAAKSVRCRALLRAALDRDPRFHGVMCFTLPEALWLAGEGFGDLLVAYPTTDRTALRALAALAADDPEHAPVVMVDCLAQLELIASAVAGGGGPIPVCIDVDPRYRLAGGRISLGPKRSPLRTPAQARELAAAIEASPATRVAGIMCYEGQIAGVGDDVPGHPLRSRLIRRLQAASFAELTTRRAEIVAAVSEVAPLRFVNAGGTGDLQLVATEPAITEATAGSGFYAPTLFDSYASFALQPAAMFALAVCRRPGPQVATLLGGGYPASGPAGADRLPRPYLPTGLRLDRQEGGGELQTPVLGAAADALSVGDLVYLRHAKAGELCERFTELHLVSGDAVLDTVPTYRGEGRCFL